MKKGRTVFNMMMIVERGRRGHLVSVDLGTKSVYLSFCCFTNLLCSDNAEGALVLGPSPVGTQTGGTPVKKKKKGWFRRTKKVNKVKDDINKNTNGDTFPNASDSLERIINIKNCPLCHRPRLNSKAEIDIITLDQGLDCCIKARPVAWKVDEACFFVFRSDTG
jgi:hypothetical protein